MRIKNISNTGLHIHLNIFGICTSLIAVDVSLRQFTSGHDYNVVNLVNFVNYIVLSSIK